MNEYFTVGGLLEVAMKNVLILSPALLLICGVMLADNMQSMLFKILRYARRTMRI